MAEKRASALALVLFAACARDPVTVDAPSAVAPVASLEPDADVAETGDEATVLDAPADAGADARARFVGGLGEAEVRRVVTSRRGLFTACFGIVSQSNPDLRGRAHFSWLIDPSGSVSLARLDDTTLGDSRVEGCVLRQLRALRFPSAPTATQVIGFPMTFHTTE